MKQLSSYKYLSDCLHAVGRRYKIPNLNWCTELHSPLYKCIMSHTHCGVMNHYYLELVSQFTYNMWFTTCLYMPVTMTTCRKKDCT